jgi:hypothetical protein
MVNNIPFINDPKYDDGWVANDPNYDNQSLLWLIYHSLIYH